jgi:hypothetical protein
MHRVDFVEHDKNMFSFVLTNRDARIFQFVRMNSIDSLYRRPTMNTMHVIRIH